MISPAHVNERGIDIVRSFHCWISLQLHSAVVICSREQLEPLIYRGSLTGVDVLESVVVDIAGESGSLAGWFGQLVQ